MSEPICPTCMEIHGRDTNTPIQCAICKKIVGCFWHNHTSQHIRACRIANLRATGHADVADDMERRLEAGRLE
jgi:hypothetical protein